MEKERIAAAYCRISTLIHGQDIKNQLVPIRDFASARGFRLTAEFCDEGISGAKERRPALDAMLADAKLGKFKTLIVMEISRLARDVRHLLNLLHELDRIGVSVVSIREGIEFNSVMGRAMIAIIGILVSVERELLRERIKTALQTKRLAAEQAGKHFSIGRPRILNPTVEAEIVSLRAKGLSIRQIVQAMNKRVGRTTVERVLREYRQKTKLSQK